jgi:hypothetical protein
MFRSHLVVLWTKTLLLVSVYSCCLLHLTSSPLLTQVTAILYSILISLLGLLILVYYCLLNTSCAATNRYRQGCE